jgi:hypothetical protein
MQLVHPISQPAAHVMMGVMTKMKEPVHVLNVDPANTMTLTSVVLGRIPAKNVQQVVTTVNMERPNVLRVLLVK